MSNIDSDLIYSLHDHIIQKAYANILCVNTPVIAVFLDQKNLQYHLLSCEYEYDFLDHFSLFNGSDISISKKFDCAILSLDDTNISYRNLVKNIKSKNQYIDIILLTSVKKNKRFIPYGLTQLDDINIKGEISVLTDAKH